MAGVLPKRRKQWTEDVPSGSLNLLRNQLATDGCPGSQYVLAKQLLENEHHHYTLSEKRENERLGVYWLIKASQQGYVEATELLHTCLRTGKGISEHNYLDVKACINTTQDVKLTRKAAKEIFASLSNGCEYITTDQLQKTMLTIEKKKGMKLNESSESFEAELLNNEEESSDSDTDNNWNLRLDRKSSNEKLTEEHLLSAAEDYSQGNLPLMTKSLCLTPPNLQTLDNIPFVYRSILHPLLVLKIFYFKILKLLGRDINSLYVRSETQLFILLSIYSFINSGSIEYALPVILYYLVFLYMVLTTCQMLQNQRDFMDFRLWSGLFLCYSGGSLNAEQAEYQYMRNNLKPYGHFFLALLVNLLLYTFISTQWVPDSELTLISFCLTFITLIGFMPKKRSKISFDMTVLLSFAVNVLAKYPYETDPVVTQGWRFLDLKIPNFASYVIGNGIEFCLNFRLALYVTIPILFLQMASKQNWRGTYQILIPHCVTLSWLQICVISSQGATMYGLLRGVLALVGVVMFLPLFGLTSILLPSLALAKWIVTSNMIHTISVFVVICSAGLLISWFLAHTRFRNYTAFIQIILMLVAFIAILNWTNVKNSQFSVESKEPKYMTWNSFQRFCHQPVWQDENIALAQIQCSELEDSLIHWDGYINSVKIESIKNSYKRILRKLPKRAYEYLSCYFGDEISDEVCENLSETSQEDCRIFYNTKKFTNECSLEKYNSYKFEISVIMSSGIWGKSPEVILVVDDYFRNFTLKLKPNDHIWFKGKLFNNEKVGSDGIIGGFSPHIHLNTIGCHTCQNKELSEITMSENTFNMYSVTQYFKKGFKYVFINLFDTDVTK